MNKNVRLIIRIVVILAVLVLVLGLIMPSNISVTRSIAIKAPKERIFEQVVNFRNWPNWNPWKEKDTSMKLVFSGDDTKPGSGMHWFGDDKITGEGEMKNMGVNGTEMHIEAKRQKPRFAMNSIIKVTDSSDGYSTVTWSTVHHTPYPGNVFAYFISMDRRMGPDFERGLADLKKYVDAHMGEYVEINEVNYPGHSYAGIRSMVFWDGLMKFFGNSYASLGKEVGNKINGHAVGLYYLWDTVNKRADVMAAFPVADTATHIRGASYVTVAPCKACKAVHKGGYSGLMKEHNALGLYLDKKEMVPSLVVEDYIVGPPQEPDSNKWVTEIYYLLK